MNRVTRMCIRTFMLPIYAMLGGPLDADTTVTVHSVAEIRQALRNAQPGTHVLVAPGEYPGGLSFSNLKGAQGKQILIAAADERRPPVFKGGGAGLYLNDPSYVELRNLHFSGAKGNGINIDDGGSYETPAHHIELRGVRVSNVGPKGNCDGVKLSGVDDFHIENCTVEMWGTGGGSAIDMVGCHRGMIRGCTFRHRDISNNTGVQAKGGTSDIHIRGNRFENAGSRAVNIGGSTGLRYFRPPLSSRENGRPRNCEAKRVYVERNVFIGSAAPVAFVGCDESFVRFNTIYCPKRWALRILQETRDPRFFPSRNGRFEDNIIAFRSDELRAIVNVGPDTAPETFQFARNVWYCIDNPTRSRPSLPTKEVDGIYGKNPSFRNPADGDFRLQRESPASKAGAYALP